MKKLLFLLLLVSFTSLFSQESKIVYLRAQSASMGVRQDENSPVSEWIVDGKEVNILVELHQTKVVIYSNTTQNYYVVNAVDAAEGSSRWLCKDKDGKSCYVLMVFKEEYPDLITIAVEYNDLVWFYICTRE
jgi:hypothetical protein